jgi:sensor c-di-GMP phosphodiesterase-like protein
MRKSTATAVTLTAALLAIAAPILLAIYLADTQARRTEMSRVMGYARDVLSRSETTSHQALAFADAMIAARSAEPCSEQNLAIMRKFDLSSSYLQAVGYVYNDRLVCSSQGREAPQYPLGPVDWVTPAGARVRINVRFPFPDTATYVVVEKQGFASIIDKDLPLEATTNEKDASLLIFAPSTGRVIASHGFVDPAWVRARPEHSDTADVRNGYVMGEVFSAHYDVGALAALPVAYIDGQIRSTAEILVPAGLAAGIILAIATLYLARLQTAMPTVLKAALKRNEFFLAYQPVVDLQTGKWVGAEALLRWRRPGGEMVRPDLFIKVAEDAGMIQRITDRVIELARRDIGELFVRHDTFHIAINLSSLDLKTERTSDLLHRLATDTRAVSGNLVAEVTERGLIEREPAQMIIQKLRASGIRVAIDDFGTGYSSLSYLESFDLDFLKIDKSFVDTMDKDTPTSQVVLHIIQMAKFPQAPDNRRGRGNGDTGKFLAGARCTLRAGMVVQQTDAHVRSDSAPRARTANCRHRISERGERSHLYSVVLHWPGPPQAVSAPLGAYSIDAQLGVFASSRSAALGTLRVIPLHRPRVKLARPSYSHVRIGNHLLPVSDPSDSTGDSEQHCEGRAWNAERAVDDARVKIHVRIKLSSDEVFIPERHFLQSQCELE